MEMVSHKGLSKAIDELTHYAILTVRLPSLTFHFSSLRSLEPDLRLGSLKEGVLSTKESLDLNLSQRYEAPMSSMLGLRRSIFPGPVRSIAIPGLGVGVWTVDDNHTMLSCRYGSRFHHYNNPISLISGLIGVQRQ